MILLLFLNRGLLPQWIVKKCLPKKNKKQSQIISKYIFQGSLTVVFQTFTVPHFVLLISELARKYFSSFELDIAEEIFV